MTDWLVEAAGRPCGSSRARRRPPEARLTPAAAAPGDRRGCLVIWRDLLRRNLRHMGRRARHPTHERLCPVEVDHEGGARGERGPTASAGAVTLHARPAALRSRSGPSVLLAWPMSRCSPAGAGTGTIGGSRRRRPRMGRGTVRRCAQGPQEGVLPPVALKRRVGSELWDTSAAHRPRRPVRPAALRAFSPTATGWVGRPWLRYCQLRRYSPRGRVSGCRAVGCSTRRGSRPRSRHPVGVLTMRSVRSP